MTVCDRLVALGYAGLSAEERVWVATRSLVDLTETGGLISYFYSPGADNLDHCRQALDRLGAGAVRAALDRVAALFGSVVPASMEERNEAMDAWPEDDAREALLQEIEDRVMPLMDDLERRLEAFLREAGLVTESR